MIIVSDPIYIHVAVLKKDPATGEPQVYYVHADHLNSPRVILDTAYKAVWRWDSDAFGQGLPAEDPDGDGVLFEYNLRFPGQYYDKETGLHYNYFRDYDPGTGRYVQSDPIGLEGGMNTYGYVGGNPLSYADPKGLCPEGTSLGWDRQRGFVCNIDPPKTVTCANGDYMCKAGFQKERPMTCVEKCMMGKLGRMALSSVFRKAGVKVTEKYGSDEISSYARDIGRAYTPVMLPLGPAYLLTLLDQCQQECGQQCQDRPSEFFFNAP